jgi:hypothetical protein
LFVHIGETKIGIAECQFDGVSAIRILECRCLEDNQTILVWFGGASKSGIVSTNQTRMVWLPRLPRTRLASAKIGIADGVDSFDLVV